MKLYYRGLNPHPEILLGNCTTEQHDQVRSRMITLSLTKFFEQLANSGTNLLFWFICCPVLEKLYHSIFISPIPGYLLENSQPDLRLRIATSPVQDEFQNLSIVTPTICDRQESFYARVSFRVIFGLPLKEGQRLGIITHSAKARSCNCIQSTHANLFIRIVRGYGLEERIQIGSFIWSRPI